MDLKPTSYLSVGPPESRSYHGVETMSGPNARTESMMNANPIQSSETTMLRDGRVFDLVDAFRSGPGCFHSDDSFSISQCDEFVVLTAAPAPCMKGD